MSSSKFQKRLLASSIAVVLGTSVALPSIAEEATNNGAKEDKVEVIQVSGIRGSLKANLNAKRFAKGVVDVITAEDIGKFPDKNVADSLSRITGVGISREFGEGEKITIRGAGPTKNRTLLNGQNVATADWFILDEPSRGFNFTLLPSSLVKGLEVYKTPQADIDEGSIGGTVILRTRKPLELDANTVKFNLQSQYSESSEKNDPSLDAMYSWRNEDQTFGALVSLTKQDRTVNRQGLEVLGWTDADADGLRRPKDIGAPIFRQDRERTTVFTSLQYAPTDSFDLTLNYMDSKMDANNHNVNLLIRPQNDTLDEFSNTQYEGNNMVAGTVAGIGSYEWDFINRESSTETSSLHLDLNYNADSFSVNVEVGKTEAKGGTYNETSWSFVPTDEAAAGYSFDLSQGTPVVNIDVDPTDGTNWRQNWTWGGNKPTTDDETFAQIDFEIPMEEGVFDSVKTGLKYRDHDRTQGRQAYSWHGPNTSSNPDSAYMWDIFEQCPTLADCGQSLGVHTVAGGVVNGNIGVQLDGSRDGFMALGFEGNADYAISNTLGEIWAINEEITAGYVSGDFSGDSYSGNVGVRVVRTTQTSSSYNFSQDSWGFFTVDRDWLTPSVMEWVSEERTYTDVLPSFNVKYDLDSETVLRFSAAKVMARANFSDLAPMTSTGALNVAQPVGSAGNPFYEPQKATQFDAAYEYYFDESSIVSATLFYKDIESYRTTTVSTEQFFNEQTEEWVDVQVTKPGNGKGGVSTGLELGFQTSFSNNTGVSANYTYTNADNDQTRDPELKGSGFVEGASDHMYNLTAFYEDDQVAARLMYNYRTEWYKGVSWTGAEVFNDSYGQWDFSSSYQYSDNLSFVFEAINLTDEEIIEYDVEKTRLMSIYQNGRRFVLGLNMSF